jgi:D-inositol-3-phosphate glycosyltransferase
VIASAVGGLPEVVGDAGLLVESERPELLAAAIADLARDPARRAALTHRGAERARARFSPEAMAAGTEDAYRSLLEPEVDRD